MNFEKSYTKKDNLSEKSKLEKQTINKKEIYDDQVFIDLKKEQEIQEKKDAIKLTEIRSSIGLEKANSNKEIQQYLKNYLELRDGDVERLELLKAKDLPKNYQKQLEALNDKRLDDVNIAIIPDIFWVKGTQPSESDAENNLILIKQSYFGTKENPDEIAWMVHELTHCQTFLDSETPEDYQKNMEKFAFDDLKREYSYPNNPVEVAAFTKQFQFLKDGGKNREDVVKMIGKYYNQEDMPFFDKLLNSIYGEKEENIRGVSEKEWCDSLPQVHWNAKFAFRDFNPIYYLDDKGDHYVIYTENGERQGRKLYIAARNAGISQEISPSDIEDKINR